MALLAKKITLDLDTSQGHFESLHHEAHGTVVLWERAGANRWHKLQPGDAHIPGLLAAQNGKQDRYISANQFHGWRLVRLLKSLRACYVDIDGCTDLPLVLEALRDAQLPPPSAVVWSGRGLHLYWFITPVPGQALPVWQRVQDTLVKALLTVGADPAAKDCTRVLRLVGSVNSKTGTDVRGLVLDSEPYDFRHLCDEVLGYRQPGKAAVVRDLSAVRAERGERIRTGSIYDRWHLVYRDLLSIAEYHFLGGIPHGHRDKWLFLSAVSLSWFANPATLRYELERQAQAWTGLGVLDVRKAIKGPLERAEQAAAGKVFEWGGEAHDPRYRFRRETLWEWMQPIVPADLAPQLRAIVSDDVKAQHEREREAKRDRVAEGRRQSHQVGRKKDTNSEAQQKPWEALSISRAAYYRRKACSTL
jgi:hypothetical protein